MVRQRHSRVRRRGLTAYKVAELLNGTIWYPNVGYDGYGNPVLDQNADSLTENYISDAMIEDWRSNRKELMRFWRSGNDAGDLSEYGFGFRYMRPWLDVRGSRNTLPWAAKVFDRGRLARPSQRERQGTGGKSRSAEGASDAQHNSVLRDKSE